MKYIKIHPTHKMTEEGECTNCKACVCHQWGDILRECLGER